MIRFGNKFYRKVRESKQILYLEMKMIIPSYLKSYQRQNHQILKKDLVKVKNPKVVYLLRERVGTLILNNLLKKLIRGLRVQAVSKAGNPDKNLRLIISQLLSLKIFQCTSHLVLNHNQRKDLIQSVPRQVHHTKQIAEGKVVQSISAALKQALQKLKYL